MIYLIIGSWEYEGSQVVGVRQNEKDAIKKAKKYCNKKSFFEFIDIQLWDENGLIKNVFSWKKE